jgi:hypothetical protein
MIHQQDIFTPDPDLSHILAALGIAGNGPEINVPYTVIPGNNGPRWLLPNRSELTQTILKEWRPYSPAARLNWAGVRLFARLEALRFLPGTRQTLLPATAGRQLLRHIGQEADALPPVILVDKYERKLLAFLLGTSQELNAVVKLPLTFAARASIRNEADTLRKLDGKHRAPQLLHYSEESGAAMQQYLSGKLGSRRCKPEYLRLLLELVRTGEPVSLRARGHRLGERLRSNSAYVDHAGNLESALDYLKEDAVVPAALVHGDFAPWNIRELDGGACTLLDWESAEWAGMPLYDLCHFFYMQTLLFSPERLFYSTFLREGSWRMYCHALDIPFSLVPRLATSFLLEMLAQGWEIESAPTVSFCLRQLDMLLVQIDNSVG